LRWGVVVAYIGAIFWSSSRPSLPDVAAALNDKVWHFGAYAGLGLSIVWASVRGQWRAVRVRHVLISTAACSLYGLFDEVHQFFVPPRTPDLRDLLADAAGALVASSAVWAWSIIARKRGERNGV
jgi:VanZ family protein